MPVATTAPGYTLRRRVPCALHVMPNGHFYEGSEDHAQPAQTEVHYNRHRPTEIAPAPRTHCDTSNPYHRDRTRRVETSALASVPRVRVVGARRRPSVSRMIHSAWTDLIKRPHVAFRIPRGCCVRRSSRRHPLRQSDLLPRRVAATGPAARRRIEDRSRRWLETRGPKAKDEARLSAAISDTPPRAARRCQSLPSCRLRTTASPTRRAWLCDCPRARRRAL